MTEKKDSYFTIEKNAATEFRDRGSRFIGYAYPVADVESFKLLLNEVKKEHPKATHHCFAYRMGIDGNAFRVSDAGEPSGSAGKPILGQIDSRQLTNVLVIVVRYFGGTLLGIPGLINAYRTAAALVLQLTPVVQKSVEFLYDLEFDYTQINEVMMIIRQFNCTVVSQEMQLFCHLKVGVPANREEELVYKLKERKGIDLRKN